MHLSQTISRRKYVSSITSTTHIAAIWKCVHKLSGKHPAPTTITLNLNGDFVTNPILVTNGLGSHFSEVSTGVHLPSDFQSIKLIAECTPITFYLDPTTYYNSPFTASKLSAALQHGRTTCEGSDGIHYQMIRHLSTTSLSFLLAFNLIGFRQNGNSSLLAIKPLLFLSVSQASLTPPHRITAPLL